MLTRRGLQAAGNMIYSKLAHVPSVPKGWRLRGLLKRRPALQQQPARRQEVLSKWPEQLELQRQLAQASPQEPHRHQEPPPSRLQKQRRPWHPRQQRLRGVRPASEDWWAKLTPVPQTIEYSEYSSSVRTFTSAVPAGTSVAARKPESVHSKSTCATVGRVRVVGGDAGRCT